MTEAPADEPHLSEDEREDVQDRTKPNAAVVYTIVRRDGEEEMQRSISALAWSGVGAGISIGLSVMAEGILAARLPDAPWTPLVDNFGYCVGFLVVVLGRQQLFTENTITPVLPVIAKPTLARFGCMLRLWGVVFLANLAGCLLFALFLVSAPVFDAAINQAFVDISHHLMENSPGQMFFKGILAGWLIAAMVWMLPSCDGSSKFWVIVMATYLIAAGDLTHVVAGSVEAFFLLLRGEIGLYQTFVAFMLPTLFGNVFGGTALFSLLAYGQVHDEIE